MTTVKNEREERGTESREPGGQSPIAPVHLRAVRLGHGGNCSSVGSVIDTLFLGAAAGGAIFAAICAAMQNEEITVAGDAEPPAAERAEPDEP
jgi:hypothetical protein